MQVWCNGILYEAETPVSTELNLDDYEDAGSDQISLDPTTKVDPNIIVTKVNLDNTVYETIISFIVNNTGNQQVADSIRKKQNEIHSTFDQLASYVADKYAVYSGKIVNDDKKHTSKENVTYRRIQAFERFFSYYIMKYNNKIVEYYENKIKSKLFNEKSDILSIEDVYSNIDIRMFGTLETSGSVEEKHERIIGLDLLKPGKFNNQIISEFTRDVGDRFDSTLYGAGITYPSIAREMLTVGLKVDTSQGEKYIKIHPTHYYVAIVRLMNEINTLVNSAVKVNAIRDHYISEYKKKVSEMNFTQAEVSKQVNEIRQSIIGGKIRRLEDLNAILANYRKYASSDKEREAIGNRTAKLANAYKIKVGSAKLNKKRGSKDG